MELAIIGVEGSGRSTLFEALTGGRGEAGRAGGKTPWRVGVAKIPDPRLQALEKLFHPKKTVPVEVRYGDVSAPPKEWRGNLLSQLASSDALIAVLRAFPDERVPHPQGSIDPHRDLAALEEELLLSDLAQMETRLNRIQEQGRGVKAEEREALLREQALLGRLKESLEKEVPLRAQPLTGGEAKTLAGFPLLSLKPVLTVVNLGEGEVGRAGAIEQEWRSYYPRPGMDAVALCAKLEMELSQLEPQEQAQFRSSLGAGESGADKLLQASLRLLRLSTFFTVVSQELRGWAVPQGTPAVKAAGKIHSDMERGFIRAEVVAFDHLMEAGGLAEARRRGTLRLEGKNYPVQDGDIITFLFNL